MNKFLYNDDEDFFSPSTSSNLASIFEPDIRNNEVPNESLMYQAPKQPKMKQTAGSTDSTKTTSQSAVICSKFVDVFKVLEKTPQSEGKCGLALIGIQSLKLYEIILYRSKQDIITRAKINDKFTFILKHNSFAEFNDDTNSQWLVHFSNSQDNDEFVEKIHNSGATILRSESKSAHEIPIKNSGITSTTTNTGTNENMSLVGEKDGDSHSDSSKTKANILSRMAKMGQSILPSSTPVSNITNEQISESDSEKETANKIVSKRRVLHQDKLKNAHVNNQPGYAVVNGQLVSVSTFPTTPISNTHLLSNIPNIPNTMMWSPQPQIPSVNDPLNIFIAENRTHNCELRMNMSQMSMKLDQILSKLVTNTVSENKNVDLKIQESEFDEIRSNNIALNNQILQLENQIGDCKHKMQNLLQINESNTLKILEQEKLIKQLETENGSQTQKLKENEILKSSIDDLNEVIENQKSEFQKLQNLYDINKKQLNNADDLNQKILHLQSKLDHYKSKSDGFAGNLKETMNSLYQQIMNNFESNDTSFQSTEIRNILSQSLKSATLRLIKDFRSNFNDVESYPKVQE